MDRLEDSFHVTYPCWLVVHESSVVDLGNGKSKLADPIVFVFAVSEEGEQCLPVFTDLDLAKRFMNASDGTENAVAFAVTDRCAEKVNFSNG